MLFLASVPLGVVALVLAIGLPERTLRTWSEPFTELRVPKLFNLRTDPFEYADITSNTYYEWFLRRDFFVLYATAMASAFLDTFKEFPPRQKAASFTVDQVMEKLTQGITSA